MIELKPYNYENRLGRCTSRDEYGNADVKGVDMSFMLGLPYEEMAILAQALNRLADFEDAEIAEDKKLREKSNKKMNDDLISRQAAIDALNGEISITGRANAEAVRGYMRLVKDRLERLPSAQPERKKGKWIDETFKPWGLVYHPYKCDQCGEHSEADSNFCPNCGADMRERSEE